MVSRSRVFTETDDWISWKLAQEWANLTSKKRKKKKSTILFHPLYWFSVYISCVKTSILIIYQNLGLCVFLLTCSVAFFRSLLPIRIPLEVSPYLVSFLLLCFFPLIFLFFPFYLASFLLFGFFPFIWLLSFYLASFLLFGFFPFIFLFFLSFQAAF